MSTIQLLRTREAAEYLRVSSSTLEKMRLAGNGPPYSKVGRTVVYDLSIIVAWVRARSRKSTSEMD